MWKEISYSLVSRGPFPKEQIRYCKGTSETGDLLYIDQHILKQSKTRRKNVAIGWLTTKNPTICPAVLGDSVVYCPLTELSVRDAPVYIRGSSHVIYRKL